MVSGNLQDWVFWVTGAVLALGGVLLAAWALFWDRSRGRKRCPKCWYDMIAAVATLKDGREVFVCSECGRPSPAVHLLRTRRWWRWGGTGLAALVLSTQLMQVPSRSTTEPGWTRFVPTTALVLLADLAKGDLTDPLVLAATRRSESAWGWQAELAARRQVGVISRDDMSSCIVTRRRWPAGAQVRIALAPSGRMFPIMGWAALRAQFQGQPARFMTVEMEPPLIHGCRFGAGPPNELLLSAPSPGRHTVYFDVTYEANRRSITQGTASCTFEVVPPDLVGVAPVRSESIEGIVRSSVQVFLTEDQPPNSAAVFVQLDGQKIWESLYAGQPRGKYTPSIGVVIEVLDSDCVIQTTTWDYLGTVSECDPGASALLVREAYEPDSERASEWRWRQDVLGRMFVRVRGDQGVACRDFQATQYWDGEVTVPMRDLLPPEKRELTIDK